MSNITIAGDAIRITFLRKKSNRLLQALHLSLHRGAAAIASGGARTPNDSSWIPAGYWESTGWRRRLDCAPVSPSDEWSVSDA